MQGYHLNFERGFALYYDELGMTFVLFRAGGKKSWGAYLDANDDVAIEPVAPPPCLHTPGASALAKTPGQTLAKTPEGGAIARAWHAHFLEAVLGFALEEEPAEFTGGCSRLSKGWAILDQYGRTLLLTEREDAPDTWMCSCEGGGECCEKT